MPSKVFFLCVLLSFNTSARVTIIKNINGYTTKQFELTKFDAIAFEYGRILSVGDTNQVLKTHPKAKIIDGHNRVMLPGLNDSKIDLFKAVLQSKQLDLSQAQSLKDVQSLLKKYANKHPAKFWLEGYGLDFSLWKGKKQPTKEFLDKLGLKRAIYIFNKKDIVALANSNAIRIARANMIKENPSGGRIIFDEKGLHTGLYYGSAVNIVKKRVPKFPFNSANKIIKELMNDLSSLGITGFHDTNAVARSYKFYKSIANLDGLSIRINATLLAIEKSLNAIIDKGAFHHEQQFLHLHTIKFMSDGEIIDYQGLMKQPYKHSVKTGKTFQSFDKITEMAKSLSQKGWQSNIQAHGDKANEFAIKLLSDNSVKSEYLRHKIESATLLNPQQINQTTTKVIVSIQPYASQLEQNKIKLLIGKKRQKQSNLWRSLINKNVMLTSGSNYPKYSANPFLGMQALTQKNINNQNISIEQAFKTYTINAAYANQQEQSLGSLEIGKWADFILIDQDIFNINPNKIAETQVIQTWVAGKKIYDNPNVILKKKK